MKKRLIFLLAALALTGLRRAGGDGGGFPCRQPHQWSPSPPPAS